MSRNTICADLQDREKRCRIDGTEPTELPLTLDEWFWLSEALMAKYNINRRRAPSTVFVPLGWQRDGRTIPLKLVESVVNLPEGGVKILP